MYCYIVIVLQNFMKAKELIEVKVYITKIISH